MTMSWSHYPSAGGSKVLQPAPLVRTEPEADARMGPKIVDDKKTETSLQFPVVS